MDLYRQELMDHYQRPRNNGTLEHADFSSSRLNPSCGDSISFQGKVDQGKISDVRFTGKGCVISQATASMLSEKVKGLTVDEVMRLDKEAITTMVGIEFGPTRLRCALLPLEALQEGLSGLDA
jgi:nitrogen fixation NifU-like protein